MLAGRFGVPGGVPVPIVGPTLSGTVAVGQTLTCNPGVWNGNPVFSYQWLRDASTPIGTNSPNYTLVAGDSTHTVKCTVTPTNNIGSASGVTTAPTGTVP